MEVNVLKKENIYIDDNLLPSLNEVEEFVRDGNRTKQAYFKEQFIAIIKDNYCKNVVISLIDIKKQYADKFIQHYPQYKNDFKQIFKNVISSNRNEGTHLLRDPRVEWYYTSNNVINGKLEVDSNDKKEFPLPKELERCGSGKRFYVWYCPILDDNTDVKNQYLDSLDLNVVDGIDLNNIKENKVDFVERQKLVTKIGEIGEIYILNIENAYLENHGIDKKAIRISEKSDSYGFDILSYRKNRNKVYPIYIEVKTTTGSYDKKFYLSNYEKMISKKYGDKYYLYRVYNASDKGKIKYKLYKGDIEKNIHVKLIKTNSTFEYVGE